MRSTISCSTTPWQNTPPAHICSFACSLAQRLLLITTGLKDRVTSVQEAAGQMVETWFTAHCSRSALSLLDLLDVTHNTGVSCL
jgi:hypothetical protein